MKSTYKRGRTGAGNVSLIGRIIGKTPPNRMLQPISLSTKLHVQLYIASDVVDYTAKKVYHYTAFYGLNILLTHFPTF